MKYTVIGITQPQYIRISSEKRINISPSGGEFSEKDVEQIKKSLYGKKLISDGALKIEGVKPNDVLPKEAKAPAAPAQAPASAAIPGTLPASQGSTPGTAPASAEVKK
jgi:hypothetical protein